MELIRAILQYYAIISISCLTFSVPIIIFLHRKTKFFDHVNNYIDAMLGYKPVQMNEENGQMHEQQQHEDDNKAEQNPSEQVAARPEDTGVSSFRMRVGSSYFCKLSSQNRISRTYEIEWFSDNEFVGTIDEKTGLFTACRAGKVGIGFEIKAAGSDTGTMLYEIEVVPDDEFWFASRLIGDLVARKKKDLVLAGFAERNIEYDNQDKNIIGYGTDDDALSLMLQFDDYDEIERVLYELPPMNQNARTAFIKQIEQRFEKVDTEGFGIHIWNMRLEDHEKNEVILYAFIRQDEDRRSFFGISQFWREYGEEDEMIENIQMAEALFCDLLPDLAPAKVRAKKKERRKKSDTEPGTETEKNPDIPDETNPEEETENWSDAEDDKMPDENTTEGSEQEKQTVGEEEQPGGKSEPHEALLNEEGTDELKLYADFDTNEMGDDEEKEE